MQKRITKKEILNEINNKNLDLHSDYGYFYFTYSDMDNDTFETKSVYFAKLSDLSICEWIDIGKEFANSVEYVIWCDNIRSYEFDLDAPDAYKALMDYNGFFE